MWSSGIIRSRGAERGFVLATTLLVTTLLTVMLAASFLLVSAEQRTTDNSFGTARALARAQAGLQNYFSLNRPLVDTSTYDSLRVTLVNGYADVVARRVRAGGGSFPTSPLGLWVVRSRGVSTNPVMAGQVQGMRTIVQFAQLSRLPTRAALVALNGVQVARAGANDNPLSGRDSLGNVSPCVATGHPASDTVAVSVPNTVTFEGKSYNGYQQTAGANPNPNRVENSFASASDLYDSIHVDWSRLVGGKFLPDYTVTSASPVSAWPPLAGTDYLVGYVPLDGAGNPQNIQIPTGQRRGMLVVTGDVTLAGGARWDGIILAGGSLTVLQSPLSYNLNGMVVTGLNIALGKSVRRDSLERIGRTYVQWSWCLTQPSVGFMPSLVPIDNAWIDTWANN